MEESKVTVQEYIDTWLLQINYPEVDVIVKSDQNTNKTVIEFVQNRYLLSIYDDEFANLYPSPYKYPSF